MLGLIPLIIGGLLILTAVVVLWRGKTSSDTITVTIRGLGGGSAAGGSAILLFVGALGVAGGLYLLYNSSSTEEEVAPNAITANATSVHPPDRGLTYDAGNTLDGNHNTAWNANGSCTGGTECNLRYEFGRPRNLDKVALVNGYAKDDKTFQANARLKDVRFVMSDNREFRKTLRDDMEEQDVTGDFGTTAFLEIDVLSVYPGDNPQLGDAALTDIKFFN